MVPLRAHLGRLLGLFVLSTAPCLHAVELDPAVQAWLKKQPELSTWTADVIQTRRLQTLTQPLVNQGQVWFSAPNRFRWQIGDPPATIAVRDKANLVILYPRLKRAEVYRLDQPNPLQDTLALLDAGFPRTEQDIVNRFNILEQNKKEGAFELLLEPKATAARRLLPKLRIVFSTTDLNLRATELQFADGSTMRNEFANARLNPPLDPALFRPDIPSDFKTIEPALR